MRVLLEFNRSARGKVAVIGEANIQRGVWNTDALVLIVSRRKQSKVVISTVPERTEIFLANLPERRVVGYNDFDADFRIVFDAEVCSIGDVLEHPEAVFFLGWDPLEGDLG